jgi:uncharacterized protein (DUF2141 family)
MVKYLFLIITLLTFGSCAIQGSISGGPTDKKPPYFDTLNLMPEWGKTNFKSEEIELNFTEFISLNKPTENILVVPNDFKIDPVAKDRSITLRIIGEPKPNTTYAIYLNNAVKDVHEGNDTLLSYVFSTGNYLDSIYYSGKIIDIKTRLPFKGVFVALYNDTVTSFLQKASNFTTSNDKGEFTLKYIHPGTYHIVAFQDMNRDFIPQPHELSGFKSEKINLNQSINDSIAIELFPASPKKAIRKITHINNDEILITGNLPIDKSEISLFNQSIKYKKVHRPDSISLFVICSNIDTLRGVLSLDKYIDTFYCKIQSKLNHKVPTLSFPVRVKPYLPFVISTNDVVSTYLNDSIKLFINDSINVPFELTISNYEILVKPIYSGEAKNLKMVFKPSGLIFANYKGTFSGTYTVSVFDSTQFGVFNINTTGLPDGTILEVISNSKVTHKHIVNSKNSHWFIDDLEKGTYVFKALFDDNKNGRWDTGNLEKMIQPEKILIYNEPFQARPNWEVDVTFDISKWK